MNIVELCSKALASTNGIEIVTSDPAAFKNIFYKARKEFPEFSSLSLITAPTGGNKLWITHEKTPKSNP